jgi:hypothetical protein
MRTNHKPAMSSLEERLRAERPTFSAPEGFTERVMERLGRQEPAPRVARSAPVFRLLLGFAGAACALLLALKFVPQRPASPDPQPLADAIASIQIPEISAEKVDALTAKLDEPLEIELKKVISDTRQAIQFVASNFLPEN